MMKHKSREYRVESIIRDLDKAVNRAGRLNLNFPNQRPVNQWSRENQSLLIHTILQEQIIPEVWITRDGAGEIRPKTVIDGKQRCSTIYQFFNNGFKLHKNTPNVKVEIPEIDENGSVAYKIKEIEIAGKKYRDLDEQLQTNFLDYDLLTREITEADELEISEIMFKLNNGKALNAAQKAITRLNVTLASEIEKISKNDFFEERVTYAPGQIKNSEGMKCVLSTLVLYTGKDFGKLSGAQDLAKVASQFNNEWSQEDLEQVNQLFLMLNNLLPFDNAKVEKYLTTNNIPILIMNVDKYCQMIQDGEITEDEYRDFLLYWFEKGVENPIYTQYEGKSISSKSHIEARMDVMERALILFLNGKSLEDEEEYIQLKQLIENNVDITEKGGLKQFADVNVCEDNFEKQEKHDALQKAG